MNGYRMPTHGDMGTVLQGNTQGTLSVSASAAQTSAFSEPGYYDIWCDVAAFIKIGPVANDVTTSSGYPVFVNEILPNVMIMAGDKIGAISTVSGTLRYHKVS